MGISTMLRSPEASAPVRVQASPMLDETLPTRLGTLSEARAVSPRNSSRTSPCASNPN